MKSKYAFLSILGISLSLGALSFVNFNKPVEVEASTTYSERSLYFNLAEVLDNVNNPHLTYADKSVTLVSSNSSNIYKTETNISNDIFNLTGTSFVLHINNEISSLLDESKLKDICYNYLVVGNNNTVSSYGFYEDKVPTPEDATYKTQRVWLYEDNKEQCSVGYINEDRFEIVDMKQIKNTADEEIYQYIDIPCLVSNIYFLKTNNHEITKSAKVASLQYGVCYHWGEAGLGTMLVPSADITLIARVVEAYLTYGENDSNGATIYTLKNVFSTWFLYKSATDDDMKSITIKDYIGWAANGNKYDGLEEKLGTFAVNVKWNTMCSRVGIDPKTGEARNPFSWLGDPKVIFFLVIALVGIAGIALFAVILIRKKKNS